LSADGGKLRVAGSGTLDFCLWGRLFPEQAVRVMKQLPAIMLIGRQFMEIQSMSLDLSRGLEALRVDTEKVKVMYFWQYQISNGRNNRRCRERNYA
jgi:hypothetical protein